MQLWIELFNRGGTGALITRPMPGRPRKVQLERVRDLLVPVLANPAQAGPGALDGRQVARVWLLPNSLPNWLGYYPIEIRTCFCQRFGGSVWAPCNLRDAVCRISIVVSARKRQSLVKSGRGLHERGITVGTEQ